MEAAPPLIVFDRSSFEVEKGVVVNAVVVANEPRRQRRRQRLSLQRRPPPLLLSTTTTAATTIQGGAETGPSSCAAERRRRCRTLSFPAPDADDIGIEERRRRLERRGGRRRRAETAKISSPPPLLLPCGRASFVALIVAAAIMAVTTTALSASARAVTGRGVRTSASRRSARRLPAPFPFTARAARNGIGGPGTGVVVAAFSSPAATAGLNRAPRMRSFRVSASRDGDVEDCDGSPSASFSCSTSPPRTAPSHGHGHSLYRHLNSPRHILAPMVAQSDLAFRLMCEHLYGAELSYTQMIHASNFVETNGNRFQTDHLDVYPRGAVTDALLREGVGLVATPSQRRALDGSNAEDVAAARGRIVAAANGGALPPTDGILETRFEARPTVVQIAAHDPDVALEAALLVLNLAGNADPSTSRPAVAAIDLNLGCPQGIARKGRYGSFLHDEDPEVAYAVLTKLRSGLPREIGVTAKVRLPPTKADADAGKLGNLSFSRNKSAGGKGGLSYPPSPEERIMSLIDCGVDWITVHGRTRFENKNLVRSADWTAVRRCVDVARRYSDDPNYPVIANGGIEYPDDVRKCLEATGASGIMSSEGLLEDPGLFGRVDDDDGEDIPSSAGELLDRQLNYADVYLDYATIFPPLPGSLGSKGGSFNVVRSHLFKFLHRYLSENPDLRSKLGDQGTASIKSARNIVAELRGRYASSNEEELKERRSAGISESWYRRHRRAKESQNISVGKAAAGVGVGVGSGGTTLSALSSVEEKKRLAKLRIRKMKEDRNRRESKSAIDAA